MENIAENRSPRKKVDRKRIDEEQKKVKAVLDLLGENTIPLHPALNRIIGNMNATMLLRQILYWQGKDGREDGWIYKTRQEFSDELGMTLNEYDTARKFLHKYGLIEEGQARGMMRTLHFRPNLKAVERVIRDYLEAPEWFEPLSKRTDRRKGNKIEPRNQQNREKEKGGTRQHKPEIIQLPSWKKSKMHVGNNPRNMSEEMQDGTEGVSGIGMGETGHHEDTWSYPALVALPRFV